MSDIHLRMKKPMMCEPVMLPSGELTSKNDENGSYLQSSIKKPVTKNLVG